VFSSFLILVTLISFIGSIPVSASWTEYSSWSSWSGWQDAAVSETDLRDVETRSVYVNTTYHYFRYSNQYSGGYGSYVYSSSYPQYYTYDFDSELEYVGTAGGYNKYRWWYSSSNYVSVYGATPYTTDNYKTQYRYRTRSLVYYYTVSYNANGGNGAPATQTKKGGTTLTLSSVVPTKAFTLTYDANGGQVSALTKSLQCTFNNWKASNGTTYSKGGSYTKDADTTMVAQWSNPTVGTLPTPTRTGYAFQGWYTAKNGGNKVTADTYVSANTTIYARWTPNTYEVKYNGNGHNSGAMSNSSHTYDETSQLNNNAYTKTGYTFAGWNLAVDGSKTAYSDGASVKNLSDSKGFVVNLYAQWVPNTYSIVYEGNGNSGGSMSSSMHTFDVPTALTMNLFTKTHYVFIGWNTKPDGTGISFTDLEIVENLASDPGATVTLYAQWSINEYSVSYDANGGEGAPDAQMKKQNEDLVITDAVPEVAQQYMIFYDAQGGAPLENDTVDCDFQGWNTRKDGAGETYIAGDVYSNNEALTLYAQWSNPVVGELKIPSKKGYTFNGWKGRFQDDQLGWGEWIKFSESTQITGNASLLAEWEANTYVVSFSANGGECPIPNKEVLYASTFGDLPTPQKTGFVFMGWYTSSVNGEQIFADTVVDNANDIVLYARWSAKNIVDVSVNLERTKTTYFIGDTFDPTQVVLTIIYEDGEKQLLSTGFDCSTPILNKVSKKRVTINYNGITTYFFIDIINPPLADVSIKSLPNQTEYNVGDTLSTAGMVLTIIYTNGYERQISSGYDVEYDFSTSGEKTVKINYSEGEISKTTFFNVVVKAVPHIYTDISQAYCGEVLSLPVYISGNTGVMGFGFEITYDKSMLTPMAVENSSLIAGNFNNSITTSNDNKFKIYWSSFEEVSEDGMLFVVHFAVADSAYGNCVIEIDNILDDTFNESWESVRLNCTDAVIDIVQKNPMAPKLFVNTIFTEAGACFEMPIRLLNSTGFSEMSLTLSYNSSVFVPKVILNGCAVVINSDIDASAGQLQLWLDSVPAFENDDVLCTITFEVAYAVAGEHSISFNSNSTVECVNAIVNIGYGAAKVYADDCVITDNIINIPVRILGNQGIMGITLNFSYNEKVLSPICVQVGSLLVTGLIGDTIETSSGSTFSVVWAGDDDVMGDGELFVLQFVLLDDSVSNTSISVDYVQQNTYNSCWEDVVLRCEDIVVEITRVVYGDADGDGEITLTDASTLQLYLSGYDVTVDEAAADADGDGEITLTDASTLQLYLSGYDVTLGPV